MYKAGTHTLDSHSGEQRGALSVKQRGAVKRAVRAAPLAAGQVQDGMLDLSPGKHIAYDKRSQNAVSRLVRKERKGIMHERLPGLNVDDTEGSMNSLAESLSLARLIARHNDPNDEYHLDAHEPVCVGHQFGAGVTFMTLTTQHLLSNMGRAVNCGGQKQGHAFD